MIFSRIPTYTNWIIFVTFVSCGPEEDDVKDLLATFFSTNRHPQLRNRNEEARTKVQNAIAKIFKEEKLTVDFEEFETEIITDGDKKQTSNGKNIIGLMKGRYWMTGKDNILVIGAHYDTDIYTKGVNDNGSGVVAMIQIIRKLQRMNENCKYNNTVIFVAFDLSGKEYMWNVGGSESGSHSFINQYLIPKVLKPSLPSARPKNFLGTIILDSILNYNDSQDTQTLPQGFDVEFQNQFNNMATNRYSGNFLALIRRAGPQPSYLTKLIQQEWSDVEFESENKEELHRLVVIPIDPSDTTSKTVMHFTKQDHIPFWSYSSGIDTILLTDTGNKRGYMRSCHHTTCDDMESVKPEHLRFLTHTIKALSNVIKKIAIKSCTKTSSAARTISNILALVVSITSITLFIY